ncbi:cell division cycle protein 20 homolog [Babylonia areolata]|uniref:cell division cycle protein 20 homolog n=1 Tax=Babylonia areolata TaxID=304850 RepID=UPI003FD498FB
MDVAQYVAMPDQVQLDSLCWWNNTLFCGTSSGRVYHLDLRDKSPLPAPCAPVHRKHVCSVQLSPDESTLACGGADGIVSVWEPRGRGVTTRLHAHKSGARALAWCPWRRNVLASGGGGSSDGYIRVWSVSAGAVKTEMDTGMQVCHVLWSEEYRELVSAHSGGGRHEVLLWTVRDWNLSLLARLKPPQGRPLSLCLSPDRTTLASASADDHLSLWKLFPKKRRSVFSTSPLNLDRFVR